MKLEMKKIMYMIILNNTISKIGDGFFYIGVLWTAMNGPSGVLAVGVIGFLEATVSFLQIPLSTIIEKSEKKQLFIFASLIRMLSVGLVASFFFLKVSFFWIALGYFIHEVAVALLGATTQTYTPQIFEADHYRIFQVKASTIQQVTMIVTLSLAGAAYYFIGFMGILVVEAIAILLYIAITSRYYLKLQPDEIIVQEQTHLELFKDGFKYVRYNQKLLYIVGVCIIANGLFAPLLQIIVPKIIFSFYPEQASFYSSAILSLIFAGMFVMGIILLKQKEWLKDPKWFLSVGICLQIPLIAFLAWQNVAVLLLGGLIFGFGMCLTNNAINFLFVQETPPTHLGRVGAILNTGAQGISAISIPLAAIFLQSGNYLSYLLVTIFVYLILVVVHSVLVKRQFFVKTEDFATSENSY